MKKIKSESNFIIQTATDLFDYFHAEKYLSSGYYAHFHNNIEIYCVYKGSMMTYINDKPYRLEAGDIIVIDSLRLHRYQSSEAAEIGYVIIGSKYMSAFWEMYPDRVLPTFLTDKKANKPVLEYISYLAEKEDCDLIENYAHANMILHAIVSAYGTEPKSRSTDMQATIIVKLVQYIYDHYNEDLSLKALSEKFGYTPLTISHLFGKYVKIDLRNFVNNIRVQNVIAMRSRPENKKKSIIDIAYQCGFNSVASFYRAYKKFSF